MEIPIVKTAYKKTFTFSFHSTLPTLLRKFVNAQPLYIKHLELDIQKIPMAHGCPGIHSEGGKAGASKRGVET